MIFVCRVGFRKNRHNEPPTTILNIPSNITKNRPARTPAQKRQQHEKTLHPTQNSHSQDPSQKSTLHKKLLQATITKKQSHPKNTHRGRKENTTTRSHTQHARPPKNTPSRTRHDTPPRTRNNNTINPPGTPPTGTTNNTPRRGHKTREEGQPQADTPPPRNKTHTQRTLKEPPTQPG